MSSRLSKKMNDEINNIIDGLATVAYTIKCEFFAISEDDKPLSLDVRFLDEIVIVQDFTEFYTDYINLKCRITFNEYALLADHYQDLQCHLIITYTDTYSKELSDGKQNIDLKRRVVIKNFVDVADHATSKEVETAGDMEFVTLEVELIDYTLYELRKRQLNFLAKDVTMENVIRFIVKTLGFKKLMLVPPDNKRVYKHLLIPPMHSIGNIFEYLQNETGLGIYHHGCSCYYSNGVLYIFPEYDTSPTYIFQNTRVYKVSRAEYFGLVANHIRDKDTNDLKILCNSGVRTYNKLIAGLENDGNGLIIVNTEKIVDGWHTTLSDKISINRDTITNLTKRGLNKAINPSSVTAKFTQSLNNQFTVASSLAKNNIIQMVFDWPHAIPMSLYPGQLISYYFDKLVEDEKSSTKQPIYEFHSRKAMCEKVIYTIRMVSEVEKRFYQCGATIQIAANVDSD